MSTVRPFTAVRYAAEGDRDISTLLAPPYDVIDEAAKGRLLAASERNFVAIDLPHMPPKQAGPAEAYQKAAATKQAWLESGVMVRDSVAALYVYQQSFRLGESELTRKMFFAAIRLEKFGSGSIFPHEQTFGGPKEDRLALTKATACNMSPILGLFEDRGGEVAALLAARLAAEPLAKGDLNDTHNRLWAVTEGETLTSVTSLMKEKPIYIADGHHRYGTAMMYRDWLVGRQGELPEQHPANFVLFVLCAMEDAGLQILPTHRVLPAATDLAIDTFRADPKLRVHELNVALADEAPRALAAWGPQAVALRSPSDGGYFAITATDASVMTAAAPDKSDAWRELGVAFLHSYLIERVVAPRLFGGETPAVSYVKSAAAAVDLASETGGACFLLQATTMAEMRGVCDAGDLMPPKSTYFYPKLASGLVIHPLDA